MNVVGTPPAEPAWWYSTCPDCGWGTDKHRSPLLARLEAAEHHCQGDSRDR